MDDFAKKGFKNHVLHQITFVNLLVISITIWLFEKVIHVLGYNFLAIQYFLTKIVPFDRSRYVDVVCT